jgi:hypothetical protein
VAQARHRILLIVRVWSVGLVLFFDVVLFFIRIQLCRINFHFGLTSFYHLWREFHDGRSSHELALPKALPPKHAPRQRAVPRPLPLLKQWHLCVVAHRERLRDVSG